MEMNVVDFINYGERDRGKSSNHGSGALVLAPLDPPTSTSAPTPGVASSSASAMSTSYLKNTDGTSDPSQEGDVPEVLEITQCCKDWRADRVKPQYFPTVDIKPGSGTFLSALFLSHRIAPLFSFSPWLWAQNPTHHSCHARILCAY